MGQLGNVAVFPSAKAALQDSAVQFQSLLDKLPAGGYICDPDGLITHFNPEAHRREPAPSIAR